MGYEKHIAIAYIKVKGSFEENMPIQSHPNQIPLDKNAIIWRYMDLNKYLSLLERSAIFFCRADKFSDPFEGSIPKIEYDYRLKEAKKSSEFHGQPFDEEKAANNIKGLATTHKNFKRGIVINCWHINNNESDAMWRLYLKDNEGVAIQSTARKVFETMDKAVEVIELSKIRYIDFDKQGWYHPTEYPHTSYNLIAPYFHKRIEFAYEQEYRIYHEIREAIKNEEYWDTQENHKGKFIKVDLRTLVDKIYLPPTADKKTVDRIKALTKQYDYDFDFAISKLQNEPYY